MNKKDNQIKEVKVYSCNKKSRLGMKMCIKFKNSAAMLEHHCNSYDYCTLFHTVFFWIKSCTLPPFYTEE
jgi:hypothetical protein